MSSRNFSDLGLEVVKEVVVIEGKQFPGYIKTSKSDKDFLWAVLYQWAQYPVNEATALMQDAEKEGWLDDKYLRKWGFDTEMNFGNVLSPSVALIKLDEGKWVENFMSFEELEEFAESLDKNLEAERWNNQVQWAASFSDDYNRNFQRRVLLGIFVVTLLIIGLAVYLGSYP